MTDTQQVTEFDAAKWLKSLRNALNAFLLKAGKSGTDYTAECAAFRALFDAVPPSKRATTGLSEILNRLASLAQVQPSLFDPNRTPHALKMQDVAISRCAVIMQLIHNGAKQ